MVEERKYYTTQEKAMAFEDIRVEWYRYLAYLEEKYPPKKGEQFELTCDYHKRITEMMHKK